MVSECRWSVFVPPLPMNGAERGEGRSGMKSVLR
jgi:hypothetical protein